MTKIHQILFKNDKILTKIHKIFSLGGQDLGYLGQESCIMTKIHQILFKNDKILTKIHKIFSLGGS